MTVRTLAVLGAGMLAAAVATGRIRTRSRIIQTKGIVKIRTVYRDIVE